MMKHTGTMVAALIALALYPSAWAVNKCTGPDGKVTYQDALCPGTAKAAEKIKAQDNSPGLERGSGADTARATLELARLQHRTAIQDGINRREPVIGMTTSQLAQAMGAPNRVNAGNYNGSLQDQLIYYRNGRTLYVYTENGVVRSIQNTEGSYSAPAVNQQNTRPCPSEQEIRNARTSASSVTDNYWVQQEKIDLVRRMERCWQ
jgi:hypothetical protein